MLNKKLFTPFVALCAISYGIYWHLNAQSPTKKESISLGTQLDNILNGTPKPPETVPERFEPMNFDLKGIEGLSERQLDDHLKLYRGYVRKINEIHASLKTVTRKEISAAYSPFRSLKVAETFAFNGMILHQLYFKNLGFLKKMGPQTKLMITQNFGSLQAYKKDLMDCASCSRGWAITGYSITDGKVYNFVLDAHNETVPILVFPLLVIDLYEHAYMIDFGVNRGEYLKLVWEHIDWDVIEDRIKKWVNKFHIYS